MNKKNVTRSCYWNMLKLWFRDSWLPFHLFNTPWSYTCSYSVVTSHAMKFSKNNKYIYPSIPFLSSILLGAFTWTLFFVSLSELFHSFQKGIPEWHRFFAVSKTMNRSWCISLSRDIHTLTSCIWLSTFPIIYPSQSNNEPLVILIQILTYSTLG